MRFYFIEVPKFTFRNTHNNTRLIYNSCGINLDMISIGAFSYGPIDIRSNGGVKIKIGNYCSIARDVMFIARDHPMKQINQHGFPFKDTIYDKLLNPLYNGPYIIKEKSYNHKGDKGPIIVDDDVRIGTGAKIMSGVHIGQGAVIAAGAVVTKDIPPYAIVGGVPAKVIKYRFSEDKIKKLLQIDYANTQIEKFRKIHAEIMKEDFDIDYILKKLKE